MILKQALEFSRLSTAPTDGCTWFPDFGLFDGCKMHDDILVHFVHKTHNMNHAQISYLAAQDILDTKLTWKQANHLLREYIQMKITTNGNWIKKLWYWNLRNIVYIGIVAWHRIKT